MGRGRCKNRTSCQNMQLQIAAKPSILCCYLANASEKLGGLATQRCRPLPNYIGSCYTQFRLVDVQCQWKVWANDKSRDARW